MGPCSRRTLAFGLVQILTTSGAQTTTIDPAFREGGDGEDHLVTEVRSEVELSDPRFEAVRLTIVLLQQIRRREEKCDIDFDLPVTRSRQRRHSWHTVPTTPPRTTNSPEPAHVAFRTT